MECTRPAAAARRDGGGGGGGLLGFGDRCEAPGCGQRDFLPFRCGPCGGTFCLEHRQPASHGCAAGAGAGVEAEGCIVCPLCGAEVRLRPGEDPNFAFDRHQAAGQCQAAGKRKEARPRCAADGCRAKVGPSSSVTCKDCGAKVCLAHRHAEDHQCSRRQAERRAASSRTWWSGGRGRGGGTGGSAGGGRGQGGGVMVCPHCGWRFQGREELIAHVESVHAPGAPGSSASKCIIL